METTSCEYSQLNSPQDWTRRREELGIIHRRQPSLLLVQSMPSRLLN
jgi:hypothetical protein